jgi:hypothetical protein
MVKLFSEAGIAIVSVSAIIFMSWKLLLWGKQIVDGVLAQMAKQNEAWQAVVDRSTRTLDEHSKSASSFQDQSIEAHKYQRDEHQKMITILDEIKFTMVRINGYKKGK